jgi:hypothetical protein
VGGGLKVTLSELPPPARFLQVQLFKLHHDLTWITQARPNQGGLAPQMGNCSDIPLATQHYSTDEMAYEALFHRRIVKLWSSQVLEHPAPRVYATAACGWSRVLPNGTVAQVRSGNRQFRRRGLADNVCIMRITMLGVCALLAAGVFVAMFLSICRAQGRSDVPPCGRRSLAIELVWAAIPCLMIITALIPAAMRILVAESTH